MMAEIPLPSFEFLGKVSGWLSDQANLWLTIVASPVDYISQTVTDSRICLLKSLQFLSFVVLACAVVTTPLDVIVWHANVFDATTQITGIILNYLQIILFSYFIYLFGYIVKGRGKLVSVLSSMFFASALLPFFVFTHYIDYRSQVLLQTMKGGMTFIDVKPEDIVADAPMIILAGIIELIVIIYIIRKLIPVVKWVHTLGFLRALLVVLLAGALQQLIAYTVFLPYFLDLVKNAGPKG